MRTPITLSLVLSLSSIAWADSPAMLLKQAEEATSRSSCFAGSGGCKDPAVYPAAMKRIEEALAADQSQETLKQACRFVEQSRGAEETWALDNGWGARGIAICMLADRESSANTIRYKFRNRRKPEEQVAHRVAAIKALYGVGLTMKHDKGKNEISVDYGALDDAKLQEYTREYYSRYASQAAQSARAFDPSYREKMFKKHAFGYVLFDPGAKEALCGAIAYDVPDPQRRELGEWCTYQAVIEAGSPLFAFRGKAASFAADSAGDAPTLEERALVPSIDGRFAPLVTIAGPTMREDKRHMTAVASIGANVTDSSPHFKAVRALVARANAVTAAKEAAAEGKKKRLATGAGNVVFGAGSFDEWELPPLVKAGDDSVACENIHYLAFDRRKKETLTAVFLVDGKGCESHDLGAMSIGGIQESCQQLKDPGKHTITAEIFTVRSGKTGGKRIENGRITDEYTASLDKKLSTFKATCTTSGGDAPASRFQ